MVKRRSLVTRGTPVRRLLAVFAVLAMLGAACGGDDEESAPAEPEATATTAPAPTAEPDPTAEPEPTEEPTAEPAADEPAPDAGDADADPASLDDPELDLGMATFAANCARCHAIDGSGIETGLETGPPIGNGILPLAYPDTTGLIDQVTNGGDFMPAFGDRLSTEEIDAVVRYIYEVL